MKILATLLVLALSACAYAPAFANAATVLASHYSRHDDGGKFVASGGKFDDQASTAAHKTLPFGTRVMVFNPATSKAEVVVINDRGPFVKGRTLDLSIGTAKRLGCGGLCKVEMEVLGTTAVKSAPKHLESPISAAKPLVIPCADCPKDVVHKGAKVSSSKQYHAKKVSKTRKVVKQSVEHLFRNPLGGLHG